MILPWSSIQHPNIELQRTIHLNWCEFGMDLVSWVSNFTLESVPIQRLYQFKWIGQTISSDSLSILKNDGLSGIECGQRSLPVKPCMVLYRFFTSFCLSNRWHLKKKTNWNSNPNSDYYLAFDQEVRFGHFYIKIL